MPSGFTSFIQPETIIMVRKFFNAFKQRDYMVIFGCLKDHYGGGVMGGWIGVR